MYRSEEHQISFFDYNQSCGMQLNKDNEWVKLADQIDWHRLEETYADMFPSKKGIPCRCEDAQTACKEDPCTHKKDSRMSQQRSQVY